MSRILSKASPFIFSFLHVKSLYCALMPDYISHPVIAVLVHAVAAFRLYQSCRVSVIFLKYYLNTLK